MLVRTYRRIGIEDLNVQGMAGNRHLARSIMDGGFFEFRRQLAYKAGYGATLVVADQPSSKTCSCCGSVKTELALSQRRCDDCDYEAGRDHNAARASGRKLCGAARAGAGRAPRGPRRSRRTAWLPRSFNEVQAAMRRRAVQSPDDRLAVHDPPSGPKDRYRVRVDAAAIGAVLSGCRDGTREPGSHGGAGADAAAGACRPLPRMAAGVRAGPAGVQHARRFRLQGMPGEVVQGLPSMRAGRGEKPGDPGRIRTCDLQIRNLPLYPAELRGHPDGVIEQCVSPVKGPAAGAHPPGDGLPLGFAARTLCPGFREECRP